MHTYLVNIICKDQTGLVANVSAALFDLGINLGTTHFSILGEGAELSAVCESQNNLSQEEIQQQLTTIEGLESADISVKPYQLNTKKADNAQVSHQITIDGGDHAGLIARLTEVFIEYGGNIVRLHADKILAQPHNLYHIEISAFIPEDRQDACLATLSNTASSLGMQFSVV